MDRLSRERPDLRIRIVSKDKDLKQLISPPAPGRAGVELYDIHTDERIDAEALKADTGFDPLQIIDMLALMGDAVDNVPGVDGVGPKTAAQLIVQYGSLDGVVAHANDIKGKRGENIRAAAAQLPLAHELVTLRRDVPLDFDLAAAETSRIHLDRLPPILRELGFNRYQDEVKALMGGAASVPRIAQPRTFGRPECCCTRIPWFGQCRGRNHCPIPCPPSTFL